MLNIIMLNIIMLNTITQIDAEYNYAECHSAECHSAECPGVILGEKTHSPSFENHSVTRGERKMRSVCFENNLI